MNLRARLPGDPATDAGSAPRRFPPVGALVGERSLTGSPVWRRGAVERVRACRRLALDCAAARRSDRPPGDRPDGSAAPEYRGGSARTSGEGSKPEGPHDPESHDPESHDPESHDTERITTDGEEDDR